MLVSLKKLAQYVSIDGLSAEEIANGLTFAGVEVEEVRRMASGTNLVIGKILECEKHPDSDHLHVLKVDLGGDYGMEQIVCGAPNARKGLKVIVARVGSVLPGGEIKKGVIRGVESNGMCCSLLELGVDAKYLSEYQQKGIEELPEDAIVGNENVLKYLNLDDEILDVKVLANRPDLLSIYNVAREIGAIFNRKVEIPEAEEISNFKTKIEIGSKSEKCSQFSIKEVRGICIKPSPKWMQNYLNAMGVRSINNVVDIGNYVMLLTGQPLHMYDADKLPKKELYAYSEYEGDFVALDENTYAVKPGDIVICSDHKPMCLGGVMGALSCAVDDFSKNLFIESASFDSASIRRTSLRLGLVSESSQRFVKGTNHFQSEEVLNLAASLLKQYADAKEFSDNVVYQDEEEKVNKISSSVEKINGRLGTSFTKEQIYDVLTRLQFKVMMDANGEFVVKVPQFRLDVTCSADLSEEVIRLLGYENVPSLLPKLDTKVGGLTHGQARLREIRYFLLERGLDECLTYSLLNKKEIKAFNLLNDDEHYEILNPLTDDHVCFRTHILHSLLKAAEYNVSRQEKNLALFETSNVQSLQRREEHLAIVLVGQEQAQGALKTIPYDFYHMKGLVEGIFTLLGIEASRYKIERLESHFDELHPGKSAKVLFQNQLVAIFGELHPQKISEYGLGKTNAVVLEMNLSPLLFTKVNIEKMSPISRFPSVSRDLAFIVDKKVEAKDLLKTIKIAGKGLVKDAFIFDVYQGANIDEGKKSIAISIVYRNDNATLTEKEIVDVQDKIKYELGKNYHVEFRM